MDKPEIVQLLYSRVVELTAAGDRKNSCRLVHATVNDEGQQVARLYRSLAEFVLQEVLAGSGMDVPCRDRLFVGYQGRQSRHLNDVPGHRRSCMYELFERARCHERTVDESLR
jgi:hypothetical protein